MTCIMLGAMPVAAETVSYSFHFSNTSGKLPTNSGYKNDNEQNYYLTINSGNVSSDNVFGARIRRASDNAPMSNYAIHTSRKQAQVYAYSSKANTGTLYYMKGKKDTSSKTNTTLDVAGRVTY